MRKILQVVLFTVGILFLSQTPCSAVTPDIPPAQSIEELYQDLFITLLLPHIEQQIDQYYSKLLTESPVVYPYEVDVIFAERVSGYRSFGFIVTLQVMPVVGPHNPVGLDQLIFSISPGKVYLKKFEHMNSYELPKHWEHIIKDKKRYLQSKSHSFVTPE